MGSQFYGAQPVVYIYASRGMAFIGEGNGLILEMQKFEPMTVEEYIANYGGDIAVKNDH